MNDSTPPTTHDDLINALNAHAGAMLAAFGEGDILAAGRAAHAAAQVLPNFDGTIVPDEQDLVALIRAAVHAMQNYATGAELELKRQPAEAAHFYDAVEAAAQAAVIDAKPDNPFAVMVRALSLGARINAPLARANEHLMRGSHMPAMMEVTSAEAQIPGLIEVINAAENSEDAAAIQLGSFAFGTYLAFFVQGALVRMNQAALGLDLPIARVFFETNGSRLAELQRVAIGSDGSPQLITAFVALARAARARVDGEFAASQKRYADAVEEFDAAQMAFHQAMVTLPNDYPQAAMLREVMQNQTVVLRQRRTALEELQQMQAKLDTMALTNSANAARMEAMEAAFDKRLMALMQKTTNITVSPEIRGGDVTQAFEQSIMVAQSNAMMVQDRAMDQVLALLEGVDDEDAETVKQEARDAKGEADLAAKIAKVEKVIDSAGKILAGAGKAAEAASNLVPYGRTVYGVLKALLS